MIKKIAKQLHAIRRSLVFISIVFVASAIYGAQSDWLADFLLQQIESMGALAGELQEMDNASTFLFWFIFLNNAIKSVLFMYLGLMVGIAPFFFVALNGMVIGFLYQLINSGQMGYGAGSAFEVYAKGILPHGIIEIPVLLIASAYGWKLGMSVISEIGQAMKGTTVRANNQSLSFLLKQSGWMVLFIVVSLFIAALVEAYITPIFLNTMASG